MPETVSSPGPASDQDQESPTSDSVPSHVVRLLLTENNQLRARVRSLERSDGEPVEECNPSPPWWHGLFNWRRWFS